MIKLVMFLPRRKKKDDDEDTNDNENSKTPNDGKVTKRKERKKKEPPKPWGRGERMIVFGVLGGTVIASLMLAMYARSWKWPGLPRISIPTDMFDETIVLEGKPAPTNLSKDSVDAFNQATLDASGVYGLYVIDLFSGTSFGISENEPFQAASLIKLPVIAAMYDQAEKHKIDLDENHILTDAEKIGGSGTLYSKPAGTTITYRELLNLMGKQSDNTAFNIVRNYLGDDFVQAYTKEIGMRDTDLETNMTTPRDIGLYFQKLWEGRLINDEDKQAILDSLTDTAYENWLRAGFPDDVVVAHKYGREVHVVNDAGIVLTSKPYVVVIMSKGVVETEADELFPKLAKIIYEHHGSK